MMRLLRRLHSTDDVRRVHSIALLGSVSLFLMVNNWAIIAAVQRNLLPIVLKRSQIWYSFIQEVLLVAALCVAVRALAPQRNHWRWGVWWLAANVLVLVELIDFRVRILFMQPLGLHLLEFWWRYRHSLRSSTEALIPSAWYSYALVSLAAVNAIPWALALWSAERRAFAARLGGVVRVIARVVDSRVAKAAIVATFVLLLLHPIRLPYQLELDVALAPVWALRGPWDENSSEALAAQCSQKLRDFSSAQYAFHSATGRSPLRGYNVVVIVLESVGRRQTSLGRGGPSATPVLARLASQGWSIDRAYALTPHSSKALYALFTGRSPSPRMENDEALAPDTMSLPRMLDSVGYETTFFTNSDVSFDNVDRILRSLGFAHVVDRQRLRALNTAAGAPPLFENSWGLEDRALLYGTVEQLRNRQPFLAAYWTVSTHHPYAFKAASSSSDPLSAYREALHYSDTVVGDLLAKFKAEHLDENTLFVIVGDHGESFGEHSTYMHQNSLFDEEIRIPMIFSHPALAGLPDPGLATQLDVTPTLLDLLDVRGAATIPIQGDTLFAQQRARRAYLSSYLDDLSLGVVEDHIKLLYSQRTDNALAFDLDADASERNPRLLRNDARRSLATDVLACRAYNQLRFTHLGP